MSVLKSADLELLSAYLDDALLPEERAAVEQRLLAEPALRAELEALRAVVDQVRALPELTAPRDFRLDPAVYGQKQPVRPVSAPRRAVVSRAYFRWGSGLSALAAAITLVIGVLGLLGPQFNNVMVQLEAVQMDDSAAQQSVESGQRAVEAPQVSAPSAVAVFPTGTLAPPLVGRGGAESGGVGGADLTPPAPAVEEAIPLEALEAAVEEEVTTQTLPEAEVFAAESLAEGESAPAAAGEPPTVGLPAGAGLPADAEDSVGPDAALGMGGGGATPAPLQAPVTRGADDEANAVDQAPPAADALSPTTKSLAPTLPVTEVALLPTPTAAPTMAIAEAQDAVRQPAVEEAPTAALQPQTRAVEDRAGLRLDPGIFIGASVVLLALAVALFALSRRR